MRASCIVFYNGEEEIGEELYLRLSDAFEKREEEPAVECVAKFININYGHNQELMQKCERLGEYSYFVASVKNYLKEGCNQKDAVTCAVNECIEKGILKDVLQKHRAEVVDMFLTTFDKKMYEEALREEGREEIEKNTQSNPNNLQSYPNNLKRNVRGLQNLKHYSQRKPNKKMKGLSGNKQPLFYL